jgi:hypothetical protein
MGARAECANASGSFALTTSPFFGSGSGANLGANDGLYPTGTVFPASIIESGAGSPSVLAVDSFSIPSIEFPFGFDVFSFTLVDQGAPTDSFQATLDPASGAVNPGLTDPPLQLRVSRTFAGQPAGSGVFDLQLTSGAILVPSCGGVDEFLLSGEPLDPATGALEIVGGLCIEYLDGQELGMDFQLKLAGRLSGSPVDLDQDGVPDDGDNCLGLANPSQRDTNGDGYGNACDADYTNDGVVGAPDFLQLARAMGSTLGTSRYDPDLDMDGDGVIGGPELLFASQSFAKPPGPSAPPCE